MSEAYQIISLVLNAIRHSSNYELLWEYHFQAANICDELANEMAVDHIEQAMMYMHWSKDYMVPLYVIDTYMMAISVYSHFLTVSPELKRNKQFFVRQALELIDKCESEINTYFKYHSTLRRLYFHNIAEACTYLSMYNKALNYILEALKTSYQSLEDHASDLYLYSQICLELHSSYDIDLSKANQAIQQCCAFYMDRYQNVQIAEIEEDIGNSYNHWALVLNEMGRPQEAVEKIQIAISYEESIENPINAYRTYCNAGLFCLYSFYDSGDKKYLIEGRRYAKKAMKHVKKRMRQKSLEALTDKFDILILLSKLALAEKKRLHCQVYLFRAGLYLCNKLSESSLSEAELIDIEYNYNFTKHWEISILKFTNVFLHCYKNIYIAEPITESEIR